MDWVNGPNLAEAKEANLLDDWGAVLSVMLDLATIIRRAHQLPQAVLHRDIRPANVMLRDGWLGETEWSVAVLDFDLSTYRGATEKSVIASGSALGYLAPEQLEHRSRESTRNASVDSFGLGMTLLFLCSGREPQASMHLTADYQETVRAAVQALGASEWKSLPARVARLIISVTRDRQADRWDIPQMIRELTRLLRVWREPESVGEADLIAEEIAARALNAYEWDEDNELARSVHSRIDTIVSGEPGSGILRAELAWSSSGDYNWSRLSKFLSSRIPRAVSLLSSGPWSAKALPSGPHDFTIVAESNVRAMSRRVDTGAKALESALGTFNFDAV
jgi:serine/threonine protein kinase